MTLAVGDWIGNAEVQYVTNGGSAAVTKGVLMKWDQTNDGYVITAAAAGQFGPFAVATETVASAVTQIRVVKRGKVAVTADGTIEPYDVVQAATGTAGQVITFASATIDAAATDDIKSARDEDSRKVGQFVGIESTGDGTRVADCADGDVIIVDLGSVV